MSYVYLLNDKKGMYYVGKTVDIKNRIQSHKNTIKNGDSCSSRELDIDFNCEILEEYGNEEDLLKGEQKWYDIYKKKYGLLLVNIERPLNTKREYYTQHKEEIKKYNEQYTEQHKKEKSDYNKRQAEKLKDIKKIRDCICGGIYSLMSKERHEETQKHINYIDSLLGIVV